jgi:formylglycine-generating enzyme
MRSRSNGTRARLGALACLALVACSAGPRSQYEVYVATDVPVPYLGQQLLVELIDDQGNDVSTADTRLIDASDRGDWPISFGVVPSGGAPPRLRVRLYRLDETGTGGLPAGTSLIDATAQLPRAASGVTNVVISLMVKCFGVAPDLALRTTCDPSRGALGPEPTLAANADVSALPEVGSWPGAATVPCASAVPNEMRCVPGGLVLLGSTQAFELGGGLDPLPEQLVQLRPFAIDVDEVTVGEVRGLVQSKGLQAPETGDPDTTAQPPECTYPLSDTDAANDPYPVNCVSWTLANQACQLLGKRLPTEAEWEYVAANLDERTSFPWGGDASGNASDPDVCGTAILARGRASVPSEDGECLGSLTPVGPVPGGNTADVTALGVRNLGGNVDEWVADYFEPYGAPPGWTTSGSLMVDPPACATPQAPPDHSIRGGNWAHETYEAHSYVRNAGVDQDRGGVTTGFRCAVSM